MALLAVPVDGGPGTLAELVAALRAALAGGPAVAPVQPGASGVAGDPGPGAAVVIATSGSTGAAKHVVLSAAALRASAAAASDRLGGPGRWLLALPATHVAGAQVIVRALLDGTEPAVLDLRDGFRPAELAAATAALGPGRRYTSLVPTQLGRVLDDSRALDALRGYAAVLVGGAALDPGLRERANAAGVNVVTTYGMSETAGGCVYNGTPLDGVRIAFDADGRIRLGGPTLADGYLGDPDRTAESFRDGWFHTGDLGRIRADGRLEVLGRADDMIITGGENVAPVAVERVLAAQEGVLAACVTGLPDREWGSLVAAAIVTTSGHVDPEQARRLRAAVRAELGRAAVPRLLHAVPAIPLRGIGKPDRAATARVLHAVTTRSE